MLSVILLFLLNPAVSIILIVLLKYCIYESTESLVVPAISVTIDFSSYNSAFIIDDLPTLGIPTIAIFI